MERVRNILSHFSAGATSRRAATLSEVIIVGSGVFGLGTAYELAKREDFKNTNITVLERVEFPAQDGSSIDSSRIIRADYADLAYAKLMGEAMPHWKGDFGKDGRFTQSGLAIIGQPKEGQTGADNFLKEALANVTKLGLQIGKEITVIDNEETARKVMGTTGGMVGTHGYVNWTSGWAHAEDGIKYMRSKIEALNRVNFRTAEVKRLLFSPDSTNVAGVELVSGEHLTADLTILATGAWTPKLIDLRGVASATGQVLTYIDITDEEERRLSAPGQPVILCENDGMFIIPPRANQLKIARHGYGYSNPTTIPHPEIPGETITVSLPKTKLTHPDDGDRIPPAAEKECRSFLSRCIPSLSTRPFTSTRLCWYTDTPSGDWLITYHPKYTGLFLATGGSGHGYKFLPTIGERIVDVIQGVDRDELGKELRERWRWPEKRLEADQVWTEDWRGEGVKGLVLEEEMKKTAA